MNKMKAVLVIDLPVALDHLIGKEVLLYISHKDRYIMTESALLRPLPEEKNVQNAPINDFYDFGKAVGWNECLDEIVGETE